MVVSRKERLKKELASAISGGDLELALAVTEDMVELMPDDPESHTSKGVILAKLDRFEEAIESIDEALGIDKEDPKAWYSKGCILMDNGRSRPALACFYKSLDIDPTEERARSRFNRCLDQMKQKKNIESHPELYHDGPSLIREDSEGRPIFKADFSGDVDDNEDDDEEPKRATIPEEPPSIPRKRRKGSLLDDDLFEEDEEEEEWESEEEEEDEFDEWEDEEEDEFEEEDEDEEPLGSIKCRCGSDISIYSDDRPYRFECPECGRTGTLK
jgi:tetratricopeptide (TPR) repeat protein